MNERKKLSTPLTLALGEQLGDGDELTLGERDKLALVLATDDAECEQEVDVVKDADMLGDEDRD